MNDQMTWQLRRGLSVIACVSCMAFFATFLEGGGEKTKPKPNGKIPPYNADLIKEIVADAQKNGDARRGALLFGLPTSACLSCHKVGDQGRNGRTGTNESRHSV